MIETKQTEEIDHYLFLLQDLVWRIVQDSDTFPSLKKRFGELFKESYAEGLQLSQAYLALCAHLLHVDPPSLEPSQFPNGVALLDSWGWCRSREIPEPTELAQLGILWMILGVRLKNEMLQRAGMKIAIWLAHSVDTHGNFHVSLWSRAQSFKPSLLSQWLYVLFTTAHRLSGEMGFLALSEKVCFAAGNREAFPFKLLVLVPSTMQPTLPHPYRPFAEEMTVGMIKFMTPDMSFMAHVSGWNSGIFSYHKKEVAIMNAGPQLGAFDELAQFGVSRTWGTKHRPFQDVSWEKTAYHCHLKGWTRLTALPLWMALDAKFQAGQAIIETTFQEKPLAASLSMILFLKAPKVILGGKRSFETGSLERYEGQASSLELKGGSEKIVLNFDPSLTLQIIPLAGGDHFWGADFLLAFSMDVAFSFKLTVKGS